MGTRSFRFPPAITNPCCTISLWLSYPSAPLYDSVTSLPASIASLATSLTKPSSPSSFTGRTTSADGFSSWFARSAKGTTAKAFSPIWWGSVREVQRA